MGTQMRVTVRTFDNGKGIWHVNEAKCCKRMKKKGDPMSGLSVIWQKCWEDPPIYGKKNRQRGKNLVGEV